MADITMCRNSKCHSRGSCYRVTAKPSAWQSYAVFQPDEHGCCVHYIKSDKPDTVYEWEKEK